MYLSNDPYITAGDTPLGGGTFNFNFVPNSAVRVNVGTPPVIPPETPSGTYYLGVILDHSDWNNSNNATHDQEAAEITVTCPPSIPPTQLGPWDGATCMGTDVYFSWNPVASLADYQIEINYSGGQPETIETQRTWYVRYGLQHSTTYWWRVRSMAQCGSWGTWSPSWIFTTESDPDVVVQPQSPADGEHCIDPVTTISWEPYFNAMGYEFKIGNDCGDGPVLPTTDHYIGVALSPGMEYNWMVRAQTHCGDWTNWSPCYTYRTTPTWVAAPVQTFPYDATACSPADTRLNWADDPEVASWDVQVGTACGTGDIHNTTDNHLWLSGLQDGVTYYWRVRANHECGPVSAWTGCWSFGVDDVPPATPPNLVPSHPIGAWSNDNTIYIDWDPSPDNCDEPGYSWVFDRDPGTIPDDVKDDEEPDALSDPLPDGQDHWFHVKAIDGAGNASETVHLGPFWIDATAPSAPEIDFTSMDTGQPFGVALLTLDWLPATDAMSGVAGYSWSFNDSPAPPTGQPDAAVDLTGLTLSLELEVQADFWFFLRSVDIAGNVSDITVMGPWICDHDWLGVGILAPTRTTEVTEGELFPVSWWLYDDGAAAVQMGRLEYSLDGGETYEFYGNMTPALVQAGTVDWIVPMADTNEALLKLTVFDTLGRSVWTRSERFTIIQVTDVPDAPPTGFDHPTLASIQPNPFNPRTTVAFELPAEARVRLRVFDMSGRLVRTLLDGEVRGAGEHHAVWDGLDAHGRAAAAGVYACQLEAAGHRETKCMTLVK
jgi:hypothetical protein